MAVTGALTAGLAAGDGVSGSATIADGGGVLGSLGLAFGAAVLTDSFSLLTIPLSINLGASITGAFATGAAALLFRSAVSCALALSRRLDSSSMAASAEVDLFAALGAT